MWSGLESHLAARESWAKILLQDTSTKAGSKCVFDKPNENKIMILKERIRAVFYESEQVSLSVAKG